MPVEIEAKFKVQDHAPVRQALVQTSATFVKVVAEINVFFDTADRRLLQADQGLRVRSMTDTRTGACEVVATHKGARAPGPLKTRVENELKVDSLDGGVRFFEALGFVQTIWFEKKRESWRLGSVKIELDTVPVLGGFVEIEGPTRDEVMEISRKLGLGETAMIRDSYAAMLAALTPAQGASCVRVAF